MNSALLTAGVLTLCLLLSSEAKALEWTFEQARQQWTPMWRPTQHVGVPGYQWQPIVLWDGSVVFGPHRYPRNNSTINAEAQATVGENYMHLCLAYGDRMKFVDRMGRKSPLIRRELDQGRLPIPHIETRDGDLLWYETVVAHLLGRSFEDGMQPRPDDKLVVHLVLRVRNTGSAKRTGHMWMYLDDASNTNFVYQSYVAEDLAPALSHRYEQPFGFVGDNVRYVLPRPERGTVVWHDEIAEPDGATGAAKNVIEWRVPLEAGEEARLTMAIPIGEVDLATGKRITELDSSEVLVQARHFWKEFLLGPGQIRTPDSHINNYLAAVVGQMGQQVGYRHQVSQWHYKTAPNVNEMYWLCNAAMALPTFDLRGLSHLTRPLLQTFIDTRSDGESDIPGLAADRRHGQEGMLGEVGEMGGEGYLRKEGFMGYVGGWTAAAYTISHGLGMWSLAQHYRITRDEKWLHEGDPSPLEAMISGFDWVAAQRSQTMRNYDGKPVHHWGLLPAAAAHDWFAGNTIFNDAYCIYGMIEVVRLLNEIGHPRADEMARELDDYRKCVHDRYVEATERARRVPLPDGTSIPYVPRDVYELDWASIDWTYTGYGPLRAGAWGALDPHNELVDHALAFLEAGMPQGQGPYIGARPYSADENWADISDPQAPRHWIWRNYVEIETMWPIGYHLFLARDDLPRFFEWLFCNFAVTFHHDWLVGVEALDGTPSNAPGDAERWRAVRNMFVNERGGYDGGPQSLWLLQAIPRSWLKPGDRMSVTDMRTCFGGMVNLDVEVSVDGNSLTVNTDLSDLAVQPREIRMRLRSGDGRPLASASINGVSARVLEGDTILLPAATSGNYKIVGSFQ